MVKADELNLISSYEMDILHREPYARDKGRQERGAASGGEKRASHLFCDGESNVIVHSASMLPPPFRRTRFLLCLLLFRIDPLFLHLLPALSVPHLPPSHCNQHNRRNEVNWKVHEERLRESAHPAPCCICHTPKAQFMVMMTVRVMQARATGRRRGRGRGSNGKGGGGRWNEGRGRSGSEVCDERDRKREGHLGPSLLRVNEVTGYKMVRGHLLHHLPRI